MPNPYTLEDVGGVPGGPVIRSFLAQSLDDSGRVRERVLLAGQGLLAEPFTRQGTRSSGALADGTIYFQGVGLLAGEVVTNVALQTNATCAGLTLAKVGVYRKDGTRVAVSADQGAAWQSVGGFLVPMIAAYTVPVSDLYYLAVIAKTGTSMPTLLCGCAAAPLPIGSGLPSSGTQTAQTDLIASATISAANSLNPWLACS